MSLPIFTLNAQEKAYLNKVFRATFDLLCANCGSDMISQSESFVCYNCRFHVTRAEMQAMKYINAEWGKDAVDYFEKWRKL